jgi:hypothetical protein
VAGGGSPSPPSTWLRRKRGQEESLMVGGGRGLMGGPLTSLGKHDGRQSCAKNSFLLFSSQTNSSGHNHKQKSSLNEKRYFTSFRRLMTWNVGFAQSSPLVGKRRDPAIVFRKLNKHFLNNVYCTESAQPYHVWLVFKFFIHWHSEKIFVPTKSFVKYKVLLTLGCDLRIIRRLNVTCQRKTWIYLENLL